MSSIQSYRLYLRKADNAAQPQGGLLNFVGNIEAGLVDRLHFPALAVSGNIPPQTVVSQHFELLGQPRGNSAVQGMDPTVPQQTSVQVLDRNAVKRGIAIGQPLLNSCTNMSKQLTHSIIAPHNMHLSTVPTNNLGTLSSVTDSGVANNPRNSRMMVHMGQQGSLHSFLSGSNPAINQQSDLVIPSHTGNSFANLNSNAINQDSLFPPSQPLNSSHFARITRMNQNSLVVSSQPQPSMQEVNVLVPREQNLDYHSEDHILDYGLLHPQSNNVPLNMGLRVDEGFNNMEMPNRTMVPGLASSVSPSTDGIRNWPAQTSDLNDGPTNTLNQRNNDMGYYNYDVDPSLNWDPSAPNYSWKFK